MTHTTDTTSAGDPARPDAWCAALVAGLSPAEEARLRRVAEALVGAQAQDGTPAPTLLDLEDAAHAARALAKGLLLAIEGLGPGDAREAQGRIGDLLGRELTTLADGLAAARSPSL